MKRIMNLQKSPSSIKDWHLNKVLKASDSLPDKVDLSPYLGKIRDQGEAGLCYAFASCYLKAIQECLEKGSKYNFSPLALAKYIKERDNTPETEGATLFNTFNALRDYGVMKEDYYPFNQYRAGSLDFPDIIDEKNIPRYKIKNYALCDDVTDIMRAISLNKPVIIGIVGTSSIYDLDDNADKFMPMPSGYLVGGHAIMIVGYDKTLSHTYKTGKTCTGFFKVANTWGETWGENGFAYMPMEYVSMVGDYGMTFWFDAYTSVDLANDPIKETIIEMVIGEKTAYVNKINKVVLDQAPIIDIKTNRALVPIRMITETLGCKVDWEDSEKKIIVSKGDTEIVLYVDKKFAYINGQSVELAQEPIIDNKTSRCLVPVRFIAEALKCSVEWDAEMRKITISKDEWK